MVLMKKSVAEALYHWNALLVKLDSKKKDDKQKVKTSISSDTVENVRTS